MGIVSTVICLLGGNVASMGACRLRTNADDRLPADPLGRIESGDGIVESRYFADVRPQPSVTHPPDGCGRTSAKYRLSDVFQGVVLEVDELLRAEVEHRLTVGSASGTDDVGAGVMCELGYHRTD